MTNKRKLSTKIGSYLFFAVIISLALISLLDFSSEPADKVTYNEFTSLVKAGEVETININPDNINEPMTITLKNETIVLAPNPDIETFKEQMVKEGIEVVTKQSSAFWGILFQILLLGVFVVIALYFVGNKVQNPTKKQDEKMLKKATNSDRRVAKFTDVAGIEGAKDELWEVVSFLKNQKQFLEVGARPPRGVLLYGPSGTGKTLLARAVAGEAGVPFFSVSGSEFVEKFVGVGASRVRELFEEARKVAPSVIYIDEIDSLAKNRNNMNNDESSNTLNQLLTEMDGFGQSEGIIVLASTNRKDSLDSAAIRPGRFDRHIEVGLPDAAGRLEILKVHSRNKRFESDVNFERLAKQTAGFSGAKLEYLMNESALMSMRHNHPNINWEDVQAAFEVAIVGPKRKSSNWSEREQRVVAYHEAGHTIVSRMLAKQSIERVTVDPAGNAGGYVLMTPKDSMLKTEREYYHDICVSVAGRVAETIIFGKENVTNGAQQDFRQASQTALNMVFVYGMSDLGALAIPTLEANMWDTLSDDLKNRSHAEMSKILKRAEEETTEFLTKNKDVLHRLALHLIKMRTVDGEILDDVLSGKWEEEFQSIPSTSGTATEATAAVEVLTISEKNQKE